MGQPHETKAGLIRATIYLSQEIVDQVERYRAAAEAACGGIRISQSAALGGLIRAGLETVAGDGQP